MNFNSNKYLIHILFFVVFAVLAFIYCKPVLEGKVLTQHDMVQATGAAREITKFKEETGKYTLWTNSMFGGMPSYTIKGEYPKSITTAVCKFFTYLLPQPASMIFWLMAGFYIMMAVLGFNPWVSFIASIGFAFSSYNIIIIEAGHVSKVIAVSYAPPIIAGIILLYRGSYWKGIAVTSFFVLMQMYANHIQISYYLGIAVALLIIFLFVKAIKEKKLTQFINASFVLGIIVLLAFGSMASRFWTTYEYGNYSTRGASELKKKGNNTGSGLDKDYAFSWSYGIAETFTYLIPNFNGGSSQGSLDDGSHVYEVLVDNNVPKQSAKEFVKSIGYYGGQLYWGEQPSTSGPSYLGAIFIFFFVLALFVVKDSLKWWALLVVVLFTAMAWGKNFDLLTDPLFSYFPLYNKFRAVTMIHSLVAVVIVFLGGYGLNEILSDKFSRSQAEKYLRLSFYVVGGVLLFFLLFGTSLFEFEKFMEGEGQKLVSADEYFKSAMNQMTQSPALANQLADALKEDRQSLFRSDIIRSLVFIILAGTLVLSYLRNWLSNKFVIFGGLALLVLVDMWGVSKRYLNDDDFVSDRKAAVEFEPTAADQEILKDPDPDYRVFNTTVSTFNDAVTSYFHKSVGGYSGVKMKRYQELVEHQISNNNMAVLNMLNTKYFILKDQQSGTPVPQRNPGACGHAWFVGEIKWVKTADEELDALTGFDPQRTAVIDEKFKGKLGDIKISRDSSGTITLTSYKPNHLVYQCNSSSENLAVFSEIYYNTEAGWHSYLDNQPVQHIRADYVLRAMKIPAGKHTIEFRFEPKSYYTGETISLVSSLIILPLMLGSIFLSVRKNRTAELKS